MRIYTYSLALILWLASVAAAYSHGISTTSAKWKLDVTERELRGTAMARAQETGWRAVVKQRSQDAIKYQAAIAADRDAAMRIADGLRYQARKYAARTCQTPVIAAGSAPAATACGVLPDMLAELEERGRIVAEAADRSRAAGLTCERIADGWAGAENRTQ